MGLGYLFTVAIFVITAVSNATNLTDGLDGLASGISAICGFVFAIFAYVSGRVDFSGFLDIMYLPGASELTIFAPLWLVLVWASYGITQIQLLYLWEIQVL